MVQTDLANHQEVVDILDETEANGTAVDIVFNNAAVQIAYRADYWKAPIEDFDLSFRINFIAVTTICYRLIPPMIERGFGRVINTTSGIKNEPEQAGYSASKAALDKFTTDLGTKLDGTGVLINLTDPGWCCTELGGPQAPNAPESRFPESWSAPLSMTRRAAVSSMHRTSPACRWKMPSKKRKACKGTSPS